MLQMISYGQQSDPGRVRENNEDHSLILDCSLPGYDAGRLGTLFAVADGMGGHAAGEVASRMACETIQAEYGFGPPVVNGRLTPKMLQQRLRRAVECANRRIRQQALQSGRLAGMGTTLSAMVLFKDHLLIGHVGDSRIYRLRERRLKRLTTDHTETQALFDAGYLDTAEADVDPRRHILTQAVGCEENMETIEMRIEPLAEQDTFLLCSDGLHDMLSDRQIAQILNAHPTPRAAGRKLVEEALAAGGEDNVTVIVVQTK